MKRIFIALLTLVLLCSCATTSNVYENKTIIKVVQTNDIHGYLYFPNSGEEESFTYNIAYLANEVNKMRKEFSDVLLIDGGDLYQGLPASNILRGQSVMAVIDAMKYDAVGLGNHEFDWGIEVTTDPDGTVPSYRVGKYEHDSQIPILASTIFDAETKERVNFTKDYTVVEKAGKRILIVGHLYDYSGNIMTERIAPYSIDNSFDFVGRVREIKAIEHPDLTVVVTHSNAKNLGDRLSSKDVQIVIGGHDNEETSCLSSTGVVCLESDGAHSYSSAEVVFDDLTGEISFQNIKVTRLDQYWEQMLDRPSNQKYLDPTVLDITKTAWNSIKENSEVVLCKLNQDISNYMGNFVTGLMLEGTKDMGAVAAFYNEGGIRSSIYLDPMSKERNITIGDLLAAVPFENHLVMYDITGMQLKKHIENTLRNSNYGSEVSGLSYTYKEDQNGFHVATVTFDDGRKVFFDDDSTLYRITVATYNASLPGSVFEFMTPVIPVEEAPIDNQVFMNILIDQATNNGGYCKVDTTERRILVK